MQDFEDFSQDLKAFHKTLKCKILGQNYISECVTSSLREIDTVFKLMGNFLKKFE